MLHFDPRSNQVTLCARKTCCPKVELVGEGKVRIIDDDGNHVTMTIEQARLMNPGIDLLLEKGKKQLLHD